MALAAGVAGAGGAEANSKPWLDRLRSEDTSVRAEAWAAVGTLRAPAIPELAPLLSGELELSRITRRAFERIVRYAGRPGADSEREAAVRALLLLLNAKHSKEARLAALWGSSEIGGEESVEPIAALLSDADVREVACAALERLPGEKALAALRAGLNQASPDFKSRLAQSLKARGIETASIPDARLLPSKPTKLQPLSDSQEK